MRVLQLVDGTLTATTDYLVDDAADTYPAVFTAGMQPGLTQYESDGARLTATQFELHGNRLVKVYGPEETVVGNPLDGVTLIHWTPTTDTAQLAELGITAESWAAGIAHGESIGRGAHPTSLHDRLAYLAPEDARGRAERRPAAAACRPARGAARAGRARRRAGPAR